MAGDRLPRVKSTRQVVSTDANRRWQGFQRRPSLGGTPNRDGSIPKPVVAAPTPDQVMRFEARESRREAQSGPVYRNLRVAIERKIGATLDFTDLPPNEQALKAGRPVARLITLRDGIEPQGFATGFLVAPDLLLTNWHVFRSPDEADGIGAQFLYERVQDGVRNGLTFELDRHRFFVNDRDLDYAVVAIKAKSVTGAELAQFQFLPLIAAKGKILKGDPVSIIQHPDGQPKRYATVNNRLLDVRDDGFLLYETDTLEGASGSPVFNRHWEVVALHHCGVPRIENGSLVATDGRRLPLDAEVPDDDLEWIANEGIRVSAIVASLAKQRPSGSGQPAILERLLSLTKDPVVLVDESSPLIGPEVAAGAQALSGTGDKAMPQSVFYVTGPVSVTFVSGPGQHLDGLAAAAGFGSAKAAVIPPEALAPEKKLRFDEDYPKRQDRGYLSDFLESWNVPLPGLENEVDALKEDDGSIWVIPYYHFSLVMSRSRRLLIWAASNVDYSDDARRFTKTRKEYGGEDWRLDPRVAMREPGLQLEDAHFYKPATKIDRGHIVRRDDGAWGRSAKEAEFGNSDTYHWTNCTPQHEAFNQSGKSGIWGQFEEHIQREVQPLGGRMTVFAGPVLNPADKEYGYEAENTIRVPMQFWKVVVCVAREGGRDKRFAYGFVFDQTEPVQRLGFERMDMDDYEIYQMPLVEISKKTGVTFDASILAADVMRDGGADESIRGHKGKRIASLSSLLLR
jgi:endonuclease G, mitochondrial